MLFLPAAGVLMVMGALLFNVSAMSKTGRHHHRARAGMPAFDVKLFKQGKHIFRYDTFGDEAYWSGQLQLDKAIEGAKNGGVGPGVSPKTALAVGLKVDSTALPKAVVNAIKKGKVNLNDPKTTLALLKLNSVVGVQGHFNRNGSLRSIGLTCAVCHSTVDNSFAPGIGKRLDGWPNQDLNVGQIVSLAPNLKPIEDALGADEATVKKVLLSWGPGKFDAELNLDGKAFRPDGKPAATRIPAAYGHLGEDLHTWTGGFGDVTYWNAYVANLELHGQGNFNDFRFNDPVKYPVATRNHEFEIRHKRDLVTPKLAALQYYQLSLRAPKPPKGSFNKAAARRGKAIFDGQGKCATCHMPPQFTDAGHNAHKPSEICIDSFQADRGPDNSYVTPQLKGLWSRSKRGFFHDGRFPTLGAVVDHYNSCFGLNLSPGQKSDLVQYLKSL
ncbi:MAG TPA: hypothetical protein VFL87_05785 [Thermoleophilaceae bacterium]|nr:hypothetical protein [Thermoleophilaceae bacterium]